MFFRNTKRLDARLKSELQYHLDRAADEYVAQGMTPGEARRRASVEFGNAAYIQEDLRDVHRMRWLADLRQDLAYAARNLHRSPGFLIYTVLTLALGAGANTAIFSLINAVMLRPLPVVHDPSTLVQIARQTNHCEACVVSYPLYEYFAGGLKSVSGAFAVLSVRHEVTTGAGDEMLNGDLVSGGYYRSLGLTPAAGRLLGAEDDAAPSPVAVLSYNYWQSRFGLDSGVIGKKLIFGTTVLTIVGVEPQGFEGTERGRLREFVAPLSMVERMNGGKQPWRQEWDYNQLTAMARLQPGVTVSRANAEVNVLFDMWRKEKAATLSPFYRARFLKERAVALPGAAGANGLRARFVKPLSILIAIVALVLILACANLSGLMLARASSRQHEIAIRRSLGAGTGRLVRQFLAETLLLAACGSAAGFAMALWFSRTLVTMMANGGRLDLAVSPDWRVFMFSAGITVFACVASALAPGLFAARTQVNPALKQVHAAGQSRLGRALVIAQLTISMTLLVGASLFIRTLVNLYHVDSGIRTGGVLTFSVAARNQFPGARSISIQRAIIAYLRSLPEVVSASAADVLPLSGSLWSKQVAVEGYTFRQGEDDSAAFNAIGSGYFGLTGTPLLLGREFSDRDTAESGRVAIVNESLARAFFSGRQAVGMHVTVQKVAYEIVGVVKDAKYENLRNPVPRTLYVPWMQLPGGQDSQPSEYWYLARVAGGDPKRLTPLLERSIPEIEATLRLRAPQTYADTIDQSTLKERMMAALGGFFGLLALLVACLGIFGLTAYQVSKRITEIGVRIALGASRRNVILLVLEDVGVLLAVGCAGGAMAAAALAPFVKSILFGVTPTDPGAFVQAGLALTVATLAASYLPAVRAARIEPMNALRLD